MSNTVSGVEMTESPETVRLGHARAQDSVAEDGERPARGDLKADELEVVQRRPRDRVAAGAEVRIERDRWRAKPESSIARVELGRPRSGRQVANHVRRDAILCDIRDEQEIAVVPELHPQIFARHVVALDIVLLPVDFHFLPA